MLSHSYRQTNSLTSRLYTGDVDASCLSFLIYKDGALPSPGLLRLINMC